MKTVQYNYSVIGGQTEILTLTDGFDKTAAHFATLCKSLRVLRGKTSNLGFGYLKKIARLFYSAVVGSMIARTSETLLAGKPPSEACFLMVFSSGAT